MMQGFCCNLCHVMDTKTGSAHGSLLSCSGVSSAHDGKANCFKIPASWELSGFIHAEWHGLAILCHLNGCNDVQEQTLFERRQAEDQTCQLMDAETPTARAGSGAAMARGRGFWLSLIAKNDLVLSSPTSQSGLLDASWWCCNLLFLACFQKTLLILDS